MIDKNVIPDTGVSRVTHLTDSMMMDCYYIVSASRPNNAEDIYYTLQTNVNNRGHIMFAYLKKSIVYGFLSAHVTSYEEQAAKIDWLFVDSRQQRRGIGQMLMRAYEDYCRANGISKSFVQPVPTIQAKKFYARYGYAPCGITYMHAKEIGR